MTEEFFDESKEQSQVKANIVAKYFWAWAKVIIPRAKKRSTKIAYIDLFSGPGRYKDGSKSTPLLVLERAIADSDMCQMLVTIFNDKDSKNTQSLQEVITSLPGINHLSNRPVILNKEVGEEIFHQIEQIRLNSPTLFFIDPWGYKGLSLQLIGSTIKDWGCDCIFFFNYNRINMGLSNSAVEVHMNSLFGQQRADMLREQIQAMQPNEKETTIVQAICQALKEIGGSHVQDFCFKKDGGSRTSHYLIFVSKHERGHSIIKDIMAKSSSTSDQGVASFEYNPNPVKNVQLSLFDDYRPLDDLKMMLLDEFAGQTMTMLEIYERHHVGKPYIKKNYKDALLELEAEGRITANPSKRAKNTFGDKIRVTFPPKQ